MNMITLTLSLLLLTAPTASAPDWVRKDPAYKVFLTRLQTAVKSGDRRAVSKLVDLPLRVNGVSGRVRYYKNPQSVEKSYDLIFTPKVRRAIVKQRFDQLFGRDQGLMIGSGEVWFDHICLNPSCNPPGPVRIKAINHW